MQKYYLAVDIGASSGRHILAYSDKGELKTEEIYRFYNGADEIDGRLYWDVDRLFSEILCGLKKAGEMGKAPASIGIDTWAVDYALVDKQGKRISPVFCYRDKRGYAASEEVHKNIDFSDLYKRTGIQFQPFNTVYQLYDDKLNGRLNKAYKMLMLPDYFNFLLTGEMKQEYTNATSTGLINCLTHSWDEDILNKIGVDKGIFAEITYPSAVVGEFTDEIAEKVGYKAKVVLPCTHDTASAVEAIDIGENVPYVSSGTWSLLGVKVKNAVTDEKSMKENWSNEGGPNYFRYQKNIMGLWLVQSLRKELCPEKSFEEIALMASKSGFNGVTNVNDPSFFSPKSMKKAFDDAFLTSPVKPGKEEDYFNAAYLGLAHCYRDTLKELSDNIGIKADKLYVVGGGAKNDYLNSLIEKVCGIEVVAMPIEATAIGNIKTQLKAKL